MPHRLRVAYTLEQCWHGVPGGTARATIEIGRRLAGDPRLELIGVAGKHRRQPHPAYAPPVAVHQLPIARPWLYETWNRFEWPPVERATGPIDVCHSTTAIPAATRAPHVVTVHDVAFMQTPDRFTRHGARVMRAGLERCRAAAGVLCPSRATRDDLIALGFTDARVHVVAWGVEAAPDAPGEVARVRATYALPPEFVLFVGTVEPRKNLSRLAAAVRAAGADLPLVVAGAAGWGSDAPDGAARFLGFVPHADLAALYRAATVFAYPSLHEGFGMPVAEAMAYGAPVVTSRGSATEETAGGAAVLVDATDVDSIAAGLLTARERAGELRRLGLARAATLSWDAAVEATLAVYRSVAA